MKLPRYDENGNFLGWRDAKPEEEDVLSRIIGRQIADMMTYGKNLNKKRKGAKK